MGAPLGSGDRVGLRDLHIFHAFIYLRTYRKRGDTSATLAAAARSPAGIAANSCVPAEMRPCGRVLYFQRAGDARISRGTPRVALGLGAVDALYLRLCGVLGRIPPILRSWADGNTLGFVVGYHRGSRGVGRDVVSMVAGPKTKKRRSLAPACGPDVRCA